jgi:hypothetical protein
MPTMMFAQRFVESFKVKDRKAITIGTKITNAYSSNNSGPIFMPSISPLFTIFAITSGSMSAKNPEAKPTTIVNSHSTEIFIFQSSKIFYVSTVVFQASVIRKHIKLHTHLNALEQTIKESVSMNEEVVVCQNQILNQNQSIFSCKNRLDIPSANNDITAYLSKTQGKFK